MGTNQHTGREYLRVSMDRSGRARSVDEQHGDNQKAAGNRSVTLGKPYVDNSVSASRYASKTRDNFPKLLDDLRKGKFGADELWLWEPSRGSRRVGEWVELIEACEHAGVTIFVTTHGRVYDPANGRDRRSLLEDAVDSEYESSKASMRSRRAAAANAAAGLPNGRVPFGYRRVYDEQTRRLVRQEAHPDEAPVIRELYRRLQSGHSLRSIAADFATRGIQNRSGQPFSAQHLRDLAMTAAYVGLRVHSPAANGPRRRYSLDGAVKGTWEPLVPEATYYAVREMLTAEDRKTARPGRAVHLLSMIARCDVCSGPLAVANRRGTQQYQCNLKGCVRVDKAELDDLAETAILSHLAISANVEAMAAAESDDTELQRVRNELAEVRSELEELEAEVEAGRLSVRFAVKVEPGLRAREEALTAQEQELRTPSALRGLIKPGKGVDRRWKAIPMSTRREVARILLSEDRLGELRVTPRPRNAGPVHVPAHERIPADWPRTGGAASA